MNKQPPKILAYLLPSFKDILWMGAFFGVLFEGRQMMNGDGDLGRHLTLGRYILDNKAIPINDIFSHTMTGQAMTPHEWLSQVLFASAERILGLNGVILLSAFVIATAFWIVLKQSESKTQSIFTAIFAGIFAVTTSMIHWLTRPHIFTFLLMALWMTVLHQMREGKVKRWWMLPILMLFWANLHGAFIAGFVNWILFGIGIIFDKFWNNSTKEDGLPAAFWRYYLLGGVSSFLITFINPSGLGLWKTSVGYLGNKYLVDHTIEYQSPNFHSVNFWPFLFFFILLMFLMGLSNKKPKSTLLIVSAAWLGMSLYSARNIPLFGIVSAPLLASVMDDLIHQTSSKFKFVKWFKGLDHRIKNMEKNLPGILWPTMSIILIIVGALLGVQVGSEERRYAFDPEVFPVAAVDWLENNPQEGEVFNYFTWGGYLLNRQWPEYLVFIDGQTDFYGEALTRQYMQVINLENGWESVFEQYGVDWAILPSDEIASRYIPVDLGWEIIYKDDTTTILHK
ncbi:MAG TPA: hypothetical protein DCL08_08380 [Anaerolineaceae bacterium]|nr:hypothetical protein [Anaerolineaceae bacterium]